jgi:ketosteroid isomerase-like protein
MRSRNVETYREGHEAFHRRDSDAMGKEYAENITWIDRARAHSGHPRSSRATS